MLKCENSQRFLSNQIETKLHDENVHQPRLNPTIVYRLNRFKCAALLFDVNSLVNLPVKFILFEWLRCHYQQWPSCLTSKAINLLALLTQPRYGNSTL